MTDKDEKSELMSLLSPAIYMWEKHSTLTLEVAMAEWQELLQSHTTAQQEGSANALIPTFVEFKGIKANARLQEWFENTNALNHKELKRLRRLALFYVAPNGKLCLKPAPLNTLKSNVFLSLVIGIAGIWTGRILFGTEASLELIIQSFGAGMALGAMASFVLDISYRHQSLYEKLCMLAPILSRQ